MYLVVVTYQGSPSDRYLLAFPVLNVVELQLIEIVTKYTPCVHCFPSPSRSIHSEANNKNGMHMCMWLSEIHEVLNSRKLNLFLKIILAEICEIDFFGL